MKRLILFVLLGLAGSMGVAWGQNAGCCTKTATASCGPADRTRTCTVSSAISYSSGINIGTGSCNIPAGAIITTCRITLTNPLVDGSTANLDHLQVTVFSGTAGAILGLDAIGTGRTINWDELGGVPVNGISFSVMFSGTSNCHPRHNHTASVDISAELCWTLPSQVYYQAPQGQDGTYLGNCMANINCAATLPVVFADDGSQASGGLYSNSINNIYRTFCPNVAGKCVSANVEYYNFEPGFDYLSILNGPTQTAALLALLNGSKPWGTPVNYTSSDSSGCLSFRFYSDYINPSGGYYITLNCTDCAVANNLPSSDCEGAIAACGTTSFSGSSNGPGTRSICSGCMLSEHYTTWYIFEIATPGTLAITIDAIDNNDDYDFALFQSNDCSNLGTPVRCSYAAINSSGSTGMAAGYTDYTENVLGDGWVSDLAVTAPQTYYLMVNNWSPGDAGFNLNFILNGGTFKPCSALPVEMTDFRGTCRDGETELYWSTASETNNDYWAVMKSTDNTVFKTSGYVVGAGNSNEMRKYYFKDAEENTGTVYYKLKQVDFDGTVSYSKLLAVECDAENAGSLIIRNFQDQGYINLSFSVVTDQKYSIRLVGSDGRILYSSDFTSEVRQASYDLPVSGLKTGIYRICVLSDSGMLQANVFIH